MRGRGNPPATMLTFVGLYSNVRRASCRWTHEGGAERVGFEPTVALQRHAISSRAQSATLASLPGGEGDRSANISQYTIRCHKQRTAFTQIRKAGYSCLDVS